MLRASTITPTITPTTIELASLPYNTAFKYTYVLSLLNSTTLNSLVAHRICHRSSARQQMSFRLPLLSGTPYTPWHLQPSQPPLLQHSQHYTACDMLMVPYHINIDTAFYN